MKIRNGFVSNSSSSSFIIRGIKIKEEELADILDLSEVDREDIHDACWSALSNKKSKLEVQSTRYYFGGEATGELVIGFESEASDGNVVEIVDDKRRDETIKKALGDIGVKNVDQLSTFFQYISNDNY